MARTTNYMVTKDDIIWMATNLGFNVKTLPASSDECATKAEIIAALYVREGQMDGYADNQLVSYENIVKGLYVDITNPKSVGFNATSFGLDFYDAAEWTVSDNRSWITPSATSGMGDASLTITIGANTGAARSGTITITDNLTDDTFLLTVNQAAYVPTYASISLGYDTTNNNACLDAGSSPSTYYIYDIHTFATATHLATNSGGTPAPAGWYSNEVIAREWNGGAFVGGSYTCPV